MVNFYKPPRALAMGRVFTGWLLVGGLVVVGLLRFDEHAQLMTDAMGVIAVAIALWISITWLRKLA